MSTNYSWDPTPLIREEAVDLLGLAAAFVREWRLGLFCALALFVSGGGGVYTITPLYEATTTLLPQQKESDSNSLAVLFSRTGPGDIFVGLLGSRSVEDGVIDRANLMSVYKTSSRAKARAMLASSTKISSGIKDTLINVSVRSRNAETAALIANAYVDSLQAEQDAMALSQAKAQREFFEQQLQGERDALARAEIDLEKQQQHSGLVQADAQTQLGLSAIASKQAQRSALQVQLTALLQGSTEQNPQVQTLRSEIAKLEDQERRLESGGLTATGSAPAAGKMPEVNLEYARKLRDVRYHEALLNSLSNRYQNARLSEAQSVTLFEVVDRAVVPERKSWPPRAMFLLAAFAFSLLGGIAAIALKLFLARIHRDPRNREHLGEIRNSFRRAH